MSSSASTDPPAPPAAPARVRRRLFSLAVGLLLAGLLWLALVSFSPAPLKTAQAFSLPRLGGGPRLTVTFTGIGAHPPAVVTFFASWCGPCHTELPILATVARKTEAAGKKIRFVGVDDNDAPASGLAFARKSGVAFPVGRDALSRVAPTFDIPGNPATVFVDGQGKIVKTVLGPIKAATLEAEIARIERT
ncbi:MAG TPA: TlpA disulfide reductase family protein [Acidimicrobiales bacterium]|nr:TlpA disulfide reductase family protein [Acidimicrobiales bacterium]